MAFREMPQLDRIDRKEEKRMGNDQDRERKRPFAIIFLILVLLCMSLTACAGQGKEVSEPERVEVADSVSEPGTAERPGSVSEAEMASASDQTSSGKPTGPDGMQPEEAENGKEISDGLEAADRSGSIEDWARAFCRRDGETIAAMSGDKVKETMIEKDLLMGGEDGYSFGWSSPWPWDEEKDYEIIEETDNSAVILYYAWVSDPHVTVWRETLTYRKEDDKCIVEEEELEMLDHICTGEEYARAYPHGINASRMNYYEEEDGSIGEALNNNALREKDSGAYDMLFAPETAAAYLLNFLENPNKVSASVEDVMQEDGSVLVSFAFAEDGSSLKVKMIQPYGKDGIWIPQDDLVNREPERKEKTVH